MSSIARLRDLVEFYSGVGFPNEYQGNVDGEFPFAKVSDISKSMENGDRYISVASNYVSGDVARKLRAKPFPKGTIVFAKIGEAIRKNRRTLTTQEMLFDNNVMGIYPDCHKIDVQYLMRLLDTIDFYKFANTTSVPSLRKSDLGDIQVSLPPLDEQKRIAAILDKADQLRQKRRQAIALLDSLTQSIFLEMFGDPVSNPMQWPSSTLIEACIAKSGIKAGPFGSALKKEDYQTSGFRVYGQEQVIAGSLKIGNYYISEQKYQSLRSCAVASGDVLLSLVGSFGKCLIVPEQFEEGIINPRLLRIRLMPKKMSSIFLKALITSNSIQSLLFSNSRGGTMGILNAGIVKNIPIVLPPIELQKVFALRIAKLLTLEDEAHEGKKSIDLLFSSLQHRAFSGHL